MKVYQILEHVGLGVMECPTQISALAGEVYTNKEMAEKRAQELWLINTTEEDRKSGWCPLHYSVKSVITK